MIRFHLPYVLSLELLFVLLVVDGLEDVLEGAVVLLQDRVLGRHVQRVAAVQRVLEAAVRKVLDRLGRVVHTQGDPGALQGQEPE